MYNIDINDIRQKYPVYRDKSAASPPVGYFYKDYNHTFIMASVRIWQKITYRLGAEKIFAFVLRHGVTMKQSLFDVLFCVFISLQVIDFTNTKKLFLESLSKDRCKNFTPSQQAIHASTSSARTACRAILRFREVIFNGILTYNTIAKCLVGIADSLVTNLYSQAGTCRVPSIISVCDIAPEMETTAPGGNIMVYPRKIDLAGTDKIRTLEYTTVVESVDELIVKVKERLLAVA